jgi:inner membrane protein
LRAVVAIQAGPAVVRRSFAKSIMDTITQGLLGAAVAEAVFRRKLGGGAVVAGTLCGVLPDADVVTRFWGPWSYLAHHRVESHSLIVLAAAAPVLGTIAWLWTRRKQPVFHWMHLVFWVLITHTLLDLCTSYGTVLLWPVSRTRYALDAVAIVDPFYTAPLLAVFFLSCVSFIPRGFSRGVAAAALVLTTGYLGLGAMQMLRTQRQAATQLEAAGVKVVSMRATPMIGSILVWRVIARDDAGGYHVGLCSMRRAGPIRFHRIAVQDGPLVRRALDSDRGSLFRWFAMDEVSARVERAGTSTVVVLDDQRYGLYEDPTRPVFSAGAIFDASGRLIDVRLAGRPGDFRWRDEWDAMWKLLGE